MKVPLNWLREYVDLTLPVPQLIERLTLAGLEVSWDDVTCTDVYTMQPFIDLAGAVIVDRMGPAMQAGLRWYPSRPPIDELEFEMDTRGTRRELVIG